MLIFSEEVGLLYIYTIDLLLAPPTAEIMELPSILGRDVLDRWRMTYDPGNDELVFEVGTADVTIPVNL